MWEKSKRLKRWNLFANAIILASAIFLIYSLIKWIQWLSS